MKTLLSLLAIGLSLHGQGTLLNGSRTILGTVSAQYANETMTGTTLNKLAKLTGAPSTVIITGTGDTSGILGIVVGGAGTSGNAQIATTGMASCVFDGATTAGHYVQNSSMTAGDCHDAGAIQPASGDVVGHVTTTNGGGGTYKVDMSLRSVSSAGGGGTVTSVSGSGPSWLTWTVTSPTSTPAISLAPTAAQTTHQVIGTCNAATTFAPCALVAGDLISGSGGGTANFLRADGAWAAPPGGGSTTSLLYQPATWMNLISNMTLTGGNDTVGTKVFWTAASGSMKGFNVAWAGGAGAKTIKITLWDLGTTNMGGASLGTATGAVNAANVYEIDFSVPIVLTQYHWYTLAAYENSGADYTIATTPALDAVVPFPDGSFVFENMNLFSAGDAQPTSLAGSERYGIEPVLQ